MKKRKKVLCYLFQTISGFTSDYSYLAAIISSISGQFESALVIVVVIIVNAILGTVQTLKAEKSLESLKKLSIPQVKVIREGKLQEIDSTELTIGDIVQIEAGDIVSGDGRIFESSSLQINESAIYR